MANIANIFFDKFVFGFWRIFAENISNTITSFTFLKKDCLKDYGLLSAKAEWGIRYVGHINRQ